MVSYKDIPPTYKREFFKSKETKYYSLYFEHSDTCPNRIYRMLCQDAGNLPVVYSSKNIKLAVCMAIFDSEKKLLLTRRNIGLRVFPHAWVMPGGHIDMGETLE